MTRPGLLSLRNVLTVPYVVLTLALAGTIVGLSYFSGKSAVDKVAEHLLTSTALRTTQAVDRHLVMSRVALDSVLPSAGGAHSLALPNFDRLEHEFSIATALNPNPNHYVYYGNRNGQFLGVNRLSPDRVELRIKTKATEPRRFYHLSESGQKRKFVQTESTIYDPRLRPWYKRSLQTKADNWASIYVDYRTMELVTTRSKVVLDANGEVEGVLATDVSLQALSDFLAALQVSAGGVAFIVEPDGALIATSTGEKLFIGEGATMQRVRADTSSSELVRQTYKRLAPLQAANRDAAQPQSTDFASERAAFAAATHQVTDSAGLNWQVMVAVPNKEFMGDIGTLVTRSAVIGVVTAVIVVMLGLFIVNWVTRDLRLLTEATQRLREGHTYTPLNITRQDEIGALAASFERMQLDLQVDELTGMLNRETFVRVLERRLREAQQLAVPQKLAVVFADLDDFKPVNDRFGHLTGDEVLVETAVRLKAAVRANDVVARYAGDEFVILLSDIGAAEALAAVIAKLDSALARPHRGRAGDAESQLHLSASMGTAIYPDDGATVDELLACADARMYEQKRARKENAAGSTIT